MMSDDGLKRCYKCREVKPLEAFYATAAGGHKKECKSCRDAYVREWKRKNPERSRAISRKSYAKGRTNPEVVLKTLLSQVKSRAKKRGIPFSLTLEDLPAIPEVCPALCIPLSRADGKNSPNLPELDRLIPRRGYVVGNVRWLSRRANTIKNSATAEEIISVALWLEEQLEGGTDAPPGDVKHRNVQGLL